MDFPLGTRLRGLPGPVLVTGHTGFKGTWLTFLLERLRVPVIGFSLTPERDSLFDRAKRTGSIPEEFLDIRNYDSLSEFISRYKPSVIIHMAAQPLVLRSYKNPRETFDTNVMGTVNILESSFKTNFVEAIIVVTSDKVYKNNNSGRAFVETDALAGKDPYSASKVATEAVVAAWQQIAKVSGGPKVASVRAGNVVGGGDWAESRLMPDLVRAYISGEEIVLRNPESTRPWQHVLDSLVGYLLGVEYTLVKGETESFNFGPDTKSLPVKEVAEISKKYWPTPVEIGILEESSSNQTEATSLSLNSHKARELLKWSPRWTQEEAVESTFQWWDKVLNRGINPTACCIDDLDRLLRN